MLSDNEIKVTKKEIDQVAFVLSKLNPGYLPKELFLQFTRLCVTSIIELVPLRNYNGKTQVYLLKRPADDPNWPDLLHTPGTVLRATDVEKGIDSALQRILTDELSIKPSSRPIFVTNILHKVQRGIEYASVFYLNCDDTELKGGTWADIDKIPDNIVPTQRGFIRSATEIFNSQIKGEKKQ